MESTEKIQLKDRTRLRNDSLWIALDWGGLMAPLAAEQAILDNLGQPGIESPMAVSDENWDIKSYQRDRTYEVDQFAVVQDRQIADDKVATGQAKLAILRVTDEYALAVRVYDSRVKALLMGAREYAALVELEQLAVALSESILAVDKEAVHLTKVKSEVYSENVHQAEEQTNIAKANLAVDKEVLRREKIQSEIYLEGVPQAQADVEITKIGLDIDKEAVKVFKTDAEIYQEGVQQAQIVADIAKDDLAVDKEELRQEKVSAEIYMETIQQAQVQADIAKAQVDVAKANVRAIMADIEAGEADIKAILAQIEQYTAQADKAQLQASVAMIYAEILTKKLSAVRLGIGQAEIAAGYGYIQSKLDDALVLYDTQKLIEGIRIDAEAALKVEVDQTLALEEAEQDLRNLETDYARLVLTFEEGATETNIEQEASLKQRLVAAKEAVQKAQTFKTTKTQDSETSAHELVASAQESAYRNSRHTTTNTTIEIEYIQPKG